jgi:PTH1 family peptidyl-tRNA hydrolase
MKLVVGLGNPGRKYEETRHNIGFRVVTELARRFDAPVARNKFDGKYSEIQITGERVLLLCPQTFMNRSGGSVLSSRDFYKINNDDILIICDDFSLPLGKLRFRPKGSAGGQKGLNDVIQRLGSQEIPRLRIGIDPPQEHWDIADYVLSKFSRHELKTIDVTIQVAADAVETWSRAGADACMNQYNGS